MSALATASLFIPKFVKGLGQNNALAKGRNRCVVVLQLSGGNDGLNTIIPYRNDIYYKSRPVIGIDAKTVNVLTDDAALHPSLVDFKRLYDDGSLAILNNVGYPQPDRSHFRSMDIWQTASASSDAWQTGWIGRYLDLACDNCAMPTQAIEVDDVLSLALKGNQNKEHNSSNQSELPKQFKQSKLIYCQPGH